MKILLTGSEGFIGTHLKSKLKHEVIPYDLVNGQDIRNMDQLSKAAEGCDMVVHLAAKCVVTESWEKTGLYFDNNIAGTLNVSMLNKPVIFASSWVAKEPTTPYGISKRAGEMLLKDHTIMRLMNVYGKGQNPAYGRVIENFIEASKTGKPMVIYGDGFQRRDFIHVSDVCDALIEKIDDWDPGTHYVSTGRLISVSRLARMVMDEYGDTEVIHKPARDEPDKCFITYGIKSIKLEEGLKLL